MPNCGSMGMLCRGMAQALYLLTVKTMCVILLELTPPPQFHAIEIISPMSHLHLSRKASRPPPNPAASPPRLALGPGQFGHHHCAIIRLCPNQDASAGRHTAPFTHLTVAIVHFRSSCFGPTQHMYCGVESIFYDEMSDVQIFNQILVCDFCVIEAERWHYAFKN